MKNSFVLLFVLIFSNSIIAQVEEPAPPPPPPVQEIMEVPEEEVVEEEEIGLQYSNDINKIIKGIYNIKANYAKYTAKYQIKNKKFSRQFESAKLLTLVGNSKNANQ